MRQTRKLTEKAKGIFSGPQPSYGQTIDGNSDLTSMETVYGGTTRGDTNSPTSWFYEDYPYAVGGKTRYSPDSLQPGSNIGAVKSLSSSLFSGIIAQEAGVDEVPTGSSVGGTAAY
jgi:hypothetical protein